MSLPILYSFRRCPYAMRARLALQMIGQDVELREVDLKNKPEEMLEVSPKGTVPVLILDDGTIIEESLDVVDWALKPDYSDTEKKLLEELGTVFIKHLNEYKYPDRHENPDIENARETCEEFLSKLNGLCVKNSGSLSGHELSAIDIVVFPFIRQLRIVDPDRFDKLPFPALHRWFDNIHESEMFKTIMEKHEPWSSDQDQVVLQAA